jgi:gamma-glutamylcyclotransferase
MGPLAMLYFAYGSNMSWDQMRDRCPSARFDSIVRAEGYRLAFTRFSKNWQCGVADIVASTGSNVWGVVFEIPDDEVNVLDTSEGYSPGRAREKNAYERRQLDVFRQGSNASATTVWTYVVVNKLKSPPKPSAVYKAIILAGGRHWKLPANYLEELERIETQ